MMHHQVNIKKNRLKAYIFDNLKMHEYIIFHIFCNIVMNEIEYDVII